jgi:hypothetical protein
MEIFLKHIEEQIESLKQGTTDALPIYAELKEVEKSLKSAIEQVYEFAIEEAENHGTKQFETKGFAFEVRNGRATYSFDHLPEWKESKDFIKEMEQKHKDAAKMADKGQTMVDDDTGEQITPAQVKYSKDVLIAKRLK